jgi:hypothetical protein
VAVVVAVARDGTNSIDACRTARNAPISVRPIICTSWKPTRGPEPIRMFSFTYKFGERA